MLSENNISQIVHRVAAANLGPEIVDDVLSGTTTDSEGRDALLITVIIKAGSVNKIKGDSVLDTLVQVQHELREAGEERLPIVEYATEEELQDSGDS